MIEVESFKSAMSSFGLAPPDIIQADGKLHRFHVEGDKHKTLNGYYVLHLNGRAAGMFGNWKTGLKQTWAASNKQLSRREVADFTAQIKTAKSKADRERQVEHESLAAERLKQWTSFKPAIDEHLYLVKKHVRPHNLRQVGKRLVVPMFDIHGALWNLQYIEPDGFKRFGKGRASGLFSPIGDIEETETILICEGWATGATLHEETGHPVLSAMNAGNLPSVAIAARSAWPDAVLVICADNDRHTVCNPGVTYATAAAKASGAKLVIPQFPDGALDSDTDFNDLAAIRRKGGRHE